MKLCVDCKFYRRTEGDRHTCTHPAATHVSRVNGTASQYQCGSMRDFDIMCGPSARYFELRSLPPSSVPKLEPFKQTHPNPAVHSWMKRILRAISK